MKHHSVKYITCIAITLHNIRGIINWCSVWGVVSGNGQATFLGAIGLAIGIGIQNIPEGLHYPCQSE